MNRYSRAVLVYVFLAVASALIFKTDHVPFLFNGYWFRKTPVQIVDYAIEVQAIDEVDLNRPTHLEDLARKEFRAERYDVYSLTQDLGNAVENKNEAAELEMIGTLISVVTKSRNVKGNLQKRTYNVVEFGESGKLQNVDNLKEIKLYGR